MRTAPERESGLRRSRRCRTRRAVPSEPGRGWPHRGTSGAPTPPAGACRRTRCRAITWRENIGSVGIQRTDSSIAARTSSRSSRTAARTSGRSKIAAIVMPICFHVVPDPAARSSIENERISASDKRWTTPSSSVYSASTSTLIRSSWASSRRAAMIGSRMSNTRCESLMRNSRISSACSTLTPKLPVMVSTGMAAAKSTLSSACPSSTKLSMSECTVLLDPVVDPPLRLGRHERRLHQRAVPAVLRAVHRQNAVEHARLGRVDRLLGCRRREQVAVAEGGVAGVEAERGEVRAVRVRQSLEEPVTRVAGELVDHTLVHRGLLAEPVPRPDTGRRCNRHPSARCSCCADRRAAVAPRGQRTCVIVRRTRRRRAGARR